MTTTVSARNTDPTPPPPPSRSAVGQEVTSLEGGGGADPMARKKRGRPRKYDADGNMRHSAQQAKGALSPSSGFHIAVAGSPPSSEFSGKRGGRRGGRSSVAGSRNWELLASLGEVFASTAGGDFTPHVVTVNTGEDVASKILSFSQKGSRGICILSANGAVSNVTIRQPGSSGGILTYEGRFEILSLSGSFTVTDTGGVKSRTGGLSVSLAGPDGRVIGGGIAGLLTAASPIQIVAGSFVPNGYNANKRKQYGTTPVALETPGSPAAGPMHYRTPATSSIVLSAPGPLLLQGSPHNAITPSPIASPLQGQCLGKTVNLTDTNQSQNDGSPHCAAAVAWNGSKATASQGSYPDINVSLLVD